MIYNDSREELFQIPGEAMKETRSVLYIYLTKLAVGLNYLKIERF